MVFFPSNISKGITFHGISVYPSQMDISITEQCNQACDYCWVNKSSDKTLDFKSIKHAVDIFLSFPLKQQTITFTTNEPLLHSDIYKKAVDYILLRSKDKNIKIITTTNGVLLNRRLRNFIIERIDNRFRLNISLDGRQRSHDAHRKLKGNPAGSTFKLSWKNFAALPRNKARVIFTITPSELPYFKQNVNFILNSGFKKLDLFPQMFTLWSSSKLKKLREELNELILRFNRDSSYDYDIRILNRLWGDSHYAKLLFASDAKFYLFEWVQVLPYAERKKYIIGDTKVGIDFAKRLALFDALFNEAACHNYNLCIHCKYKNFCCYPIPLFIWCQYNKYSFNKYFKNFCSIAKIFIELSTRMKNNIKNELDSLKLSKYI